MGVLGGREAVGEECYQHNSESEHAIIDIRHQ